MDAQFIAIVQKLMAEQGKDTLLNPAKGKSLLADYTRGWSWLNYAQFLRSAYRNSLAPSLRNGIVGFRLVCSSL